jgi:hypothetical protein
VRELDQAVVDSGFELAGASLTAAVSHEAASDDVVLELRVDGLQSEATCIELWGRLSDLVSKLESVAVGNSRVTERIALVVRSA